jgi:integrase
VEIEQQDILPSRERLQESHRVISALKNNDELPEMREITDSWITANGYDRIDPASHEMIHAFMLRARKAHELQLLNHYGTGRFMIEPPFANLLRHGGQHETKSKPATRLTFAECVRRYREHQRPGRAPSTLVKERAQDRLMFAIFGTETLIADIDREDTRRFEATIDRLPANFNRIRVDPAAVLATPPIPDLPMKAETKNAYLKALRAVLKFAVDEGYIDRSPMGASRTHRDKVRDREKRHPFSPADLQLIFNPDTYPPRSQPAQFWLPLLASFTGARRGELVQLLASDVQVIDGADCIAINDEGEGKRLKTATAMRIVPVHDQLKNIGFLKFVETVRRRGADARLFEELFAAANPGDAYGKCFAKYLRRIGVRGKQLHCARHSAKQLMENAGVAGEIISAIFGWAGEGGMRSVYGGKFPPRLLAEAVNKIAYDGLDPAWIKE